MSVAKISSRFSLVTIGLLLFQGTALASFPDVPESHPNYGAIQYVQEHGIVSGYPDGTYHPDQTINRAEFVKILVQAKADESTIRACYDEVEPAHWAFVERMHDEWYAPYVCYAKKFHLIDGYPDGTFRPANNINFAEAAKIIANAIFGVEELEFEKAHTETWYTEYVFQLTSNNAVPLSIHSADQLITRGEMAEMIYRLKAEVFQKPSKTYEDFFRKDDTIAVTLYFGDKKVMEESDCGATRPVTRYIPKTSTVADATLRLLLQGVKPTEQAQGLTSSFDNRTGYYGNDVESLLSYYRGITIVNGVATLKFSGDAMVYLNNTACVQQEIKGSIAQTSLQFPSIKSIQYSIDGQIVTEWDA